MRHNSLWHRMKSTRPSSGDSPISEHSVDEKRAGGALILKAIQMGATKLLYLLGTLVLGRLLTPADFGLVAIATVAVVTVMTATDTGMTTALVQADHPSAAHYDIAWTISLLRGVLVSAALAVSAPWIAALFGEPSAVELIRLMALLPLISGAMSPRLAHLMRELKFSRVVFTAVLAVVVELIVSIALAHQYGGTAIVIGKLIGAAALTLSSYFIAPYAPRFRLAHASAMPLIAFGRWIFAVGLVAVISDVFLKVLIARQVSVAALGLFSLSERIAEAPSMLASEATGSVAFPLYVRLRENFERVRKVVRAHLIGFMFCLLPASALLIALAQPLETYVLGPAWHGTAPIIMLLTAGFVLEVTFLAISSLLKAAGAGRQLFSIELTQYIVLIAGVALLTPPLGVIGAGLARVFAGIALLIATPFFMRRALGFALPATLRTAGVLTAASICAGAVSLACALLFPTAAGVACAALAGGGAFLALIWLVDVRMNLEVRSSIALFFPALRART